MTSATRQSLRIACGLLALLVAGGLSASAQAATATTESPRSSTAASASSTAASAASSVAAPATVAAPAQARRTGIGFDPPVNPASLTGSCDSTLHASTPYTGDPPWQQKRLQLTRTHAFATGRLVTVAVVDTGVDINNPQLTGVLDRSKRPVSFVPLDVDQVPPTRDCDGHGTFVAGIIAARQSSDTTFVGVAPRARILPIRVTKGETGGSADDLADGINWAADQGVDIINVSIVTGTPNEHLREAVANALRQGIVVVVAAGNTGNKDNAQQWPAGFAGQKGFQGLIVVGATDQSGAVAAFSTTSVPVSVAAPGQGVLSTAPIQGHRQDEGTSFAAPFVSGVAALILETYGKNLTPVQVKRRLELTADPPGREVPDSGYGYGIVNPYDAVTALLAGQRSAPRHPGKGPAIKPIAVQQVEDTTTRSIALGVAAGALLLGLIALGSVATYRRGRARNWQPS